MDRLHEFQAFSPVSSNTGSPSGDMATFQHPTSLQEQPSNWLRDLNEVPPTPHSLPSRSRNLTGTTSTPNSTPTTGSFFMGNVNAQHIGLAGCGVERSEEQIKVELDQMYTTLQRSERYQKYRSKQPALTPTTMMEREEAEKEEAERKGCKVDEKKAVWPEFLERAFWRALVRWPPMGRKKCMLNGAPRGRNELIQQSIFGDTGINRSRKQVSSHIQVLKIHLRDEPSVLMYMATQEDDKRRRRGSGSSHTHHSAHVRSRHVFSDTTPSPQHQGSGWVSQFWSQVGTLQADLVQGVSSKDHASSFPYSITDFSMRVDNDDQVPHYFTQMSSSTPLCNLESKDHALWRHQFPEFDFLQSQMQDWPRTGRKVLVCDASIKVLTQARPNADLSITFNLDSRRDLTGFEYLECISRFYDGGNLAPDPKFDGANSNYLKEQRMPCVYMPGSYGSSGSLRLAFGSKFWVNRMLKYQSIRNKDNGSVNRSLRYLTATQDIYAIERGTGRVECIMTILWRFSPTKSSEEEGTMTWRSFSFRGDSTTEAEPSWTMGNTPYHGSGVEAVNRSQEQSQNYPLSAPAEQTFFSPTSQPPPSFHQPQYNSFPQPLQLPVETLASMNPGNDPYNVSPSSTSSFSSISDPYTSQEMFSAHVQMPEYAFTNNNSHTSLPTSAFSPAIQVPEYNPFVAHNAEASRAVYHTSTGTASTNSPAFVHPGHHSCGNSPTVALALPTSNPNLPPSTGPHHIPVAVAYPSPNPHPQHPSPPHYQAQNLLSVTSNQEHIFHAYHPPHLAPHSPHTGAVFPQPLTTQQERFRGENLVPSSSEVVQSLVPSHEVWSVPPPIAAAPAPRSLGSRSEGEEREGWEGG